MESHGLSQEDRELPAALEAFTVARSEFAHVCLIPRSKFHEAITHARFAAEIQAIAPRYCRGES